MELSVSAWCLQKKLYSKEIDILDFIVYCNNNSIKNVELLDCFINNNLDKTIELLSYLNMKVSSYSIGNDFVYESKEKREQEELYVLSGIDTAVTLNTKLLRIFSGNVKDNISYEQGKEWILQSLSKVSKYAEEKGVTLVLENHGFFAGKSNQVKEIIETIHSPYLKSTSDVGNFILVEENPLDAVANLNNHIGYIHFKDFKYVGDDESVYSSISGKHFQGVILGKGDVPLKEIVDYLNKIGYNGYLSIEYEGVGDPLLETSESIAFAKSIINQRC
jgi:sugar phosphate isomerase/epimerase